MLNKSLLGAAAALLICNCASAQITLNSARVACADAPALAKFYEAAFGLKEVNRLEFGDSSEVFLNFGATVDEAKANPAAQIVIMGGQADSVDDAVPHIIFNVADIEATAAAVRAAGGTMPREPSEFGDTGIVIGFAQDPIGNLVELIQPAPN